jgi:crotonobetainyl-CoA:carnitine CoA-transferase CaiB-like acyl-CoA transferase
MVHLTNNAIKFTNAQADPTFPAPTLGQDNNRVFGSFLGLSQDEIAQLKENKII